MAYTYETPNLTGGFDDVVVDLAGGVPSFVPMLLFFIFSIVMIGGSANQFRRSGTTDVPMWMTMAGLVTTSIALLMTLKDGIINLPTLSIVLTVTIASALWLFLSRSRQEI